MKTGKSIKTSIKYNKIFSDYKGAGKPRGERAIIKLGIQLFPISALETDLRIWKFGKITKNFEGN
jgi:hypothetical protein